MKRILGLFLCLIFSVDAGAQIKTIATPVEDQSRLLPVATLLPDLIMGGPAMVGPSFPYPISSAVLNQGRGTGSSSIGSLLIKVVRPDIAVNKSTFAVGWRLLNLRDQSAMSGFLPNRLIVPTAGQSVQLPNIVNVGSFCRPGDTIVFSLNVDSDNAVQESDENNNNLGMPIRCPVQSVPTPTPSQALPDLMPESVMMDSNYIYVRFKNIGGGLQSPFPFNIKFKSLATGMEYQPAQASYSIPAPGGSMVSGGLTRLMLGLAPSQCSGVTTKIQATIDSDNVITEVSESNNSAVFNVMCP